MKLAANLLLGVFWQALGEALTLAGSSSLGPERIVDLLADSNIGATILRARQPQIVAALQGHVPATAAFDVDTLRKDMQYMLLEAGIAGHTLPLTRRTLECFDRVSSDGNGSVDSVAYPALWLAQQEVPRKEGVGAAAPSPQSLAGA
jgi:3-hydroxyisobutyrate dehydrogenase